MNEKMKKRIEFTILLEKMKEIKRRTKVVDTNRRETDAEHSFSVALMAYLFREYTQNTNLEKMILMLLIHDLVEIDAGDTFAYDTEGYKTKKEREIKAAERIYSLLPEEDGPYLKSLWYEFEAGETNEAKYANALDRLQPILNNLYNHGGTWNEYDVKFTQLEKRMEPIKEFNLELYQYIHDEAKKYFKN